MTKRRKFTAEFKAKVALEALRVELASAHLGCYLLLGIVCLSGQHRELI